MRQKIKATNCLFFSIVHVSKYYPVISAQMATTSPNAQFLTRSSLCRELVFDIVWYGGLNYILRGWPFIYRFGLFSDFLRDVTKSAVTSQSNVCKPWKILERNLSRRKNKHRAIFFLLVSCTRDRQRDTIMTSSHRSTAILVVHENCLQQLKSQCIP